MDEKKNRGRRNGLIYCTANLALMAVMVICRFSVAGAVSAACLAAFSYIVVAVRCKSDGAAGGYTALLAFVYMLTLAGVVIAYMKFSQPLTAQALGDGWVYGVFGIVGGIILGIVGLTRGDGYGLSWLGALIAGLAAAAYLFGGGSGLLPEMSNLGRVVAALYAGGAALWYALSRMTLIIAPEKKKSVSFMGVLLFGLAMTVFFFGRDDISGLAYDVLVKISPVSQTALPWWKVILFSGVAAVLAVIMYDFKNRRVGTDALIFVAIAGAPVLVKVLYGTYFTYSWVFLAVYAVGALSCIRNEKHARGTFAVDNEGFMLYLLLGLILGAKLIAAGLWMMALAVVLFSAAFYTESEAAEKGNAPWILAFCCIAALALAWMWRWRLAADNVLLIILSLMAAVAAMTILNLTHRTKRTAPKFMRTAICVMFALLCAIPAMRGGADIETSLSPNGETQLQNVAIDIRARGGDNAVKSAYYYWRNGRGERIGENITLDGLAAEVLIVGECLTVVALDSRGVQSSRICWFPYDLAVAAVELEDEIAVGLGDGQ